MVGLVSWRRLKRWRLKRYSCVLCAMACVAAVRIAAATEYHGRVNFGGVPVPGATVTLIQGDKVVSVVTDSQGLYEFPDVADGAWKLEIRMHGFAPYTADVTVAANAPQVAWELKLLSLGELLAQAQPAKPPVAAALTPRPAAPTPKAAAQKAAAAKGAEPNAAAPAAAAEEPAERPAEGLLINGSVNNAATSVFSLAPAFGNRRAGAKSMYTGGLVVVVDNSVFDARQYSLTGLQLPKGEFSRVTTGFTLGGPLNIPHLLYHGPNFFLAYQWTRNSNINVGQGLVPNITYPFTSLTLAGLPVYAPAAGLPAGCTATPGAALPGNVIPASCISPVARALLALYPSPSFAGNTSYNYETNEQSNIHQDALQSRLDKQLGRRDDVYGGFGFQSIRANSANLFHFVDTTNTLGLQGNANWSHRFNHQIYVVGTYQFTRQRTELRPQFENRTNISGNAGISASPATGGNLQDAADWGPPALGFDSVASLSDANRAFNRNRTDALSSHGQMTRGHHNITVGGDFRRQEFNELSQSNPRGAYTFTGAASSATGAVLPTSGSDFADFLFGVPDTSAIAYGNADKYFRQSVYDLYATDDWRVRPELTINAGFRWEYGAPLTELKGRLVNLNTGTGFSADAPVCGQAYAGCGGLMGYPTSLVRPDKRGFEPRVAASWRPLPASTLVIKAGYGIYDDTSLYLSTAQSMAQQAPLSTSTSVSNIPATCPLTLRAGFINCSSTTADSFAVDPNLRVGYAQAWQLSAQRDLPAALVITATYQGTKGTRGMQQFLPNTCPLGVTTSACTSYPVGYVYRTSNGNSTREAGIVQLRRRLRSGITASLQYTYSKSLDDDAQLGGAGHVAATAAASSTVSSGASASTSSAGIAQNWLNLRGERGLSTFDQRHLLAASIQYTSGMGMGGGTLLTGWRGKLLKEWTLSTQITAGSGLPETPEYLAAVPGTGVTGTLRPNPTGAPLRAYSNGVFLNQAAFVAPAAGQWGTARRDSLPGPDQFSLNGSLGRTFRLHDPFNLDVRMDASNLLNHAVYAAWNNVWNSSIFGEPTAVNPMRSMQLTGRLRF
jgi:hypothetical protein